MCCHSELFIAIAYFGPDAGEKRSQQRSGSIEYITYSSLSQSHSEGHSKRAVKALLKPLPTFVRCERAGWEGPHSSSIHVTTAFLSIPASSLLAPSDPCCNWQLPLFSHYIASDSDGLLTFLWRISISPGSPDSRVALSNGICDNKVSWDFAIRFWLVSEVQVSEGATIGCHTYSILNSESSLSSKRRSASATSSWEVENMSTTRLSRRPRRLCTLDSEIHTIQTIHQYDRKITENVRTLWFYPQTQESSQFPSALHIYVSMLPQSPTQMNQT